MDTLSIVIIKKRRELIMKVKIEDGCIACGACESLCDAVFSVEDVATVNESEVDSHKECVEEAAEACPVGVIVIE